MTDQIVYKMTNLYFKGEQPLGNNPKIAFKQSGYLEQVPQPWLAMLELAGTPAQSC